MVHELKKTGSSCHTPLLIFDEADKPSMLIDAILKPLLDYLSRMIVVTRQNIFI